jgi:hypothetical protein
VSLLIPAQKSAAGIVGGNAEGLNGPRQGIKGKVKFYVLNALVV